jgi:hypothetical protein
MGRGSENKKLISDVSCNTADALVGVRTRQSESLDATFQANIMYLSLYSNLCFTLIYFTRKEVSKNRQNYKEL